MATLNKSVANDTALSEYLILNNRFIELV